MEVQTALCQCAAGTCDHQQRPILTFSDLPSELRQQIFSLAIISPLVISVEVRNSIADPKLKVIAFNFAERRCFRDISLLSVCKESNAVYKKVCYASLPIRRRSLIRFDPTATTILITNFLCAFIKDPDIKYGINHGWRKQQWVRDIKSIGVLEVCFQFMCMVCCPTGDDGVKRLGRLFEMFENLGECVSFHDNTLNFSELALFPMPWNEVGGSNSGTGTYIGSPDLEVCEGASPILIRQLLEDYRDRYNQSFKVPRVGPFPL
jgi:hypothetical protein